MELKQKHESPEKDGKTFAVRKAIADNIDEGAWFVCSKVWDLVENPPNESNELLLNERLAEIQVNAYI